MSTPRVGLAVLSWAHGHVGIYAGRLREFNDVKLVSCWDDDVERGQRNAAQFEMHFCPNLDEVLNNPAVQCVIIGAETSRHAEIAVAAAQAGKDILLQKPMALTLEECDRIIAAVEASGVWFSMAWQMRQDPANIAMKQLVQDGAVGRVGIVRRRHCIGMLFNPAFANTWHVKPEMNRGMWMDDASHACDWLYWMFGTPCSVIAEIGNVLTNVAPDDAGFAIFRYQTGMMAEIHNSSVTLAAEATTEIYGDQGVIIQNNGDAPSTSVRAEHSTAVKLFRRDQPDRGWMDQGVMIPASQGDRIAGVARPFVDAYLRREPLCSARDGRISVEMLLASYSAAELGTRVTIPLENAV